MSLNAVAPSLGRCFMFDFSQSAVFFFVLVFGSVVFLMLSARKFSNGGWYRISLVMFVSSILSIVTAVAGLYLLHRFGGLVDVPVWVLALGLVELLLSFVCYVKVVKIVDNDGLLKHVNLSTPMVDVLEYEPEVEFDELIVRLGSFWRGGKGSGESLTVSTFKLGGSVVLHFHDSDSMECECSAEIKAVDGVR